MSPGVKKRKCTVLPRPNVRLLLLLLLISGGFYCHRLRNFWFLIYLATYSCDCVQLADGVHRVPFCAIRALRAHFRSHPWV